ncbi:hypothetical protein ACHWQZ_G019500 [Mnemiopsis leidyi]
MENVMLDEIVMRADSVMMIKLATKKDFQVTTTKFTIVNKSLKRKARRLEGKSVRITYRISGLFNNILDIEYVELRTCSRCKSDLLDETDRQVECESCETLELADIPEYVVGVGVVNELSNKQLKYRRAITIKFQNMENTNENTNKSTRAASKGAEDLSVHTDTEKDLLSPTKTLTEADDSVSTPATPDHGPRRTLPDIDTLVTAAKNARPLAHTEEASSTAGSGVSEVRRALLQTKLKIPSTQSLDRVRKKTRTGNRERRHLDR